VDSITGSANRFAQLHLGIPTIRRPAREEQRRQSIGTVGGRNVVEQIAAQRVHLAVIRPSFVAREDPAAVAQLRGEPLRLPFEARRFLQEVLKDGPVPSQQIQREARSAGIASSKTVRHAKAELGVKTQRRAVASLLCVLGVPPVVQ